MASRIAWVFVAVLVAASVASVAVTAETVVLVEDGAAKLPIVVAANAHETVRGNADDLARYLKRMSGAAFNVVEGTGERGLMLGVPGDFPKSTVKAEFTGGPFGRDEYRLVSTGEGLYLLGATPNAVAFAVWDLLHQFGYRYYFPSENWEIVPERKSLKIAVDRTERPDFYNRSAPRGGIRRQLRPWSKPAWQHWCVRNRTQSSFVLHTGHAYDAIIRRNRGEFDEHPEYLALVNGKRGGTKFCISNPGLRALVVRYAVDQIKGSPDQDSVSLDPSDGGGWCECDPCKKMGSVSDRVVLLSNEAAEAINALGLGDKYVGIYAYNDYSLPPTVKLHPKVIPSLATAFIKGGQTFDEMLAGWSRKADMIGIREYYGVPVWHQSMPGSGKAGRHALLPQAIRDQYAADARFMNAESDEAWGPHGLGYYIASRLLWDVDVSAEGIVDDFLKNCFGQAQAPMRAFYDFIGSGPRHSEHMVGTMYRTLGKAREMAADPAVVRRIDDLVIYTRYVELMRRFEESPKDERGQEAFDQLVRYLWRSRTYIMSDSIAMFWYLSRGTRRRTTATWNPGKKEGVVLPPEHLRTRGEEPFSEEEIRAFIDEGIRNHAVLDFTPREYSTDLVPAYEALRLAKAPPMGKLFYGGADGITTTRGAVENYTWVADAPRTIALQVCTGLVYSNRGPATVTLAFRDGDAFRVLESTKVPEDKEWHEVSFVVKSNGLYRVVWREPLSGTRVKWPKDLSRTVQSALGHTKQVNGRHSWYFYVPKGTRIIGAYEEAAAGALHNADGEKVLDFKATPTDYISVEVPERQDGRLWSVRAMAGRLRLLNVPPYVAARPDFLLLPREVVEARPAK